MYTSTSYIKYKKRFSIFTGSSILITFFMKKKESRQYATYDCSKDEFLYHRRSYKMFVVLTEKSVYIHVITYYKTMIAADIFISPTKQLDRRFFKPT